MKRLKHTGLIREYVKEFSRLCLRYSTWPRRSYYLTSWTTCKVGRARIEEAWCPRPSHDHGDGSRGYACKEGTSKGPSGKDGKGKDKRKEFTPKTNCFLCEGPHWVRDCPKRKALNAMIEEKEKEGDAQVGSYQAITWSSWQGDYTHRLIGRKGRLHRGTHGRLQDGTKDGLPTEGQGCATAFPTLNGYPRGGETMHGPYGHRRYA
ncbi:hypothetical protein AAG906_021698 [Vitis piasezkii]